MFGRIARWSAAIAAPLTLAAGLAAPAHAAASVTWKGDRGDEGIGIVVGQAPTFGNDPQVDILSTTFASKGGFLMSTVKLGQVSTNPPPGSTGLKVQVMMHFGGSQIYLYSERTLTEGTVYRLGGQGATSVIDLPCPHCTGKWDTKASTVSEQVPLTDFNAALKKVGAPPVKPGTVISQFETQTRQRVDADGHGILLTDDDDVAPTALSLTYSD